MLVNVVELLGCLLLSVPALLIGFCIVGSIVAALRAVSCQKAVTKNGKGGPQVSGSASLPSL
jgi:hypothetical protein